MNHYLSEPCVDCPSICVKPFISSFLRCYKCASEKSPAREGHDEWRAFESNLYIGINDVSKFNWMPLACTLHVCMSLPLLFECICVISWYGARR